MKKIGQKVLGIIMALIGLSVQIWGGSVCLANDNSIDLAYKQGYTWYDEEGKSEYEGNNVYDSELTEWGGYLRYIRNRYIVRLDLDRLETGNTFQNRLGIPYEQVEVRSIPIIVSIGKYVWRNLYLLGGMGYSFNEIEIEQYPSDPFGYGMDNSMVYSMILGYDKEIGNSKWYGFGEVRKIWSKAEVHISTGQKFKEDLGNVGLYIGLGRRF